MPGMKMSEIVSVVHKPPTPGGGRSAADEPAAKQARKE
jgi:hypothetical protein